MAFSSISILFANSHWYSALEQLALLTLDIIWLLCTNQTILTWFYLTHNFIFDCNCVFGRLNIVFISLSFFVYLNCRRSHYEPNSKQSKQTKKLIQNTPNATAPNATAPNVPDFVEDPFKDYRYEDPFNIQDPFDDAEGKKPYESDHISFQFNFIL